MAFETKYNGNKVTIHANGDVYVNGRYMGIRQWSDPKRWSNDSGRALTEYKGKSLEEVLKLKGY